jgi:thioredoxin-related protein
MQAILILSPLSVSIVRWIPGILLLFWAGSFNAGFAMSSPAPSAIEFKQASGPGADRPISQSPPDAFIDASPCGRPHETSWVPIPTWQPTAMLDLDDVFFRASTEQRLTMLIVYAEGCPGWSRMVAPLVADEEVAATSRKRFHVYAVNADDREQAILIDGRAYSASQLVDMLGVETYPAFALFEEDGRLVQMLEHPDSARELQSTLETAIAIEYGMARLDQPSTYEASPREAGTVFEYRVNPSPSRVLSLKDESDERPLAVFFEEPSCHHCDHLWQHTLSDPQTKSMLGRFRIARVELQADTVVISSEKRHLPVAQWSRELGITSTPTVVLFDKTGRRVGHTSSHADLFRFQSLLDYVISHTYKSDPNFTHFLRHRARHLRSHGYKIDSRIY